MIRLFKRNPEKRARARALKIAKNRAARFDDLCRAVSAMAPAEALRAIEIVLLGDHRFTPRALDMLANDIGRGAHHLARHYSSKRTKEATAINSRRPII